jgi:phosphate starvation-inducible protein PhoH and related proteins
MGVPIISERKRRKRKLRLDSESFSERSFMQNSFVSAKNAEQKKFILSIVNNPITIVTGMAGCGKSFCAIGVALEHLLRGKCDKIIISRPLVCTGKSMPAIPGDIKEKMEPYWGSAKSYIEDFLGKSRAWKMENEGTIRFEPLELMRGANLRRTYLILTEGQNATYEQLKMLLTRIDDDETRIIIDGDIEQTDLRLYEDEECPLEEVMDRLGGLEELGMVELKESLRHPVVQKVARLL